MSLRTRIIVLALVAAAVAAVIAAKRLGPGTQERPGAEGAEAVILEFNSGQCPMCVEMSGVLEGLKREFGGRLDVRYIDALKYDDARKKYGITALPAQVLLDAGGNKIDKNEGVMTREEVLQRFREHGIELTPTTQKSRDERR